MPCSLLWLAYRTPELRHPKRKEIAETILKTSPDELHINARKILELFRGSLQSIVANNGAVDMRLYITMRYVACTWRADTSEMEGIMNLISIGVVRGSSQISLALLDARVSNVKDPQ